MKKFVFAMILTLLTIQLPAAVILTMSSLGDGRYQIYGVTNIIQATNAMEFYRVKIQ